MSDLAIDLPDDLQPTDSQRTLILRSNQLYETLPVCSQASIIRVLNLESSSGDNSAPLRGELQLVSLEDRPPFAALSYVWGSWSSPPDVISCNGAKIEISTNCKDALMSLRNELGAITIWVDSICINQGNESERASQIALMEDIYTYSQPTYIWLGNACERKTKAIECIKLLAHLNVPPTTTPWFHGMISRSPKQNRAFLTWEICKVWTRLIAFGTYRIKRKATQLFKATDLECLLGTDWLERVWTFQEIVLASDPIIVCGSNFISWRTFCQGFYSIEPASEDSRSGMHRTLLGEISASILWSWKDLITIWNVVPRPSCYFEAISRHKHQVPEWSVSTYFAKHLHVVTKFLNRALKIPFIMSLIAFLPALLFGLPIKSESRTFDLPLRYQYVLVVLPGLVALVTGILLITRPAGPPMVKWKGMSMDRNRTRSLNLDVLRAIRTRKAKDPKDKSFAVHGIIRRSGLNPPQADYTKSLGLVYKELFIALINYNPYFINLILVAGGVTIDAPSWVPNWSAENGSTWVSPGYIEDPIISEKYLRPDFKVEGDILKIPGHRKGTVIFVANPFPLRHSTEEPLEMKPEDTINQICACISSLSELMLQIKQYKNIGSEAVYLSLLNIFLADQIEINSIAPIKTSPSEDLSFLFNRWWRLVTANLRSFNLAVEEGDDSTIIHNFVTSHSEVVWFLGRCWKRFQSGRSIFLLDNGTLGTGPSSTCKGDCVAVITGVSMPLLLRKTTPASRSYRTVGPAFVEGLMKWGWTMDLIDFETWMIDEPFEPVSGSQRRLSERIGLEELVLV